MNDKKIVVPSGMARVAWDAMDHHVKVHGPAVGCAPGSMCSLTVGLEEALRWMIENWGTAPNAQRMPDVWYGNSKAKWERFKSQWKSADNIPFVDLLIFFVSRYHESFLALEPEVPEEINDLILPNIESEFFKPEILNERIIEAYRRGRKNPE